jgi:hypothetical protein
MVKVTAVNPTTPSTAAAPTSANLAARPAVRERRDQRGQVADVGDQRDHPAEQDHRGQYGRKHADQQQLRPADQQAETLAEIADTGDEISHDAGEPPWHGRACSSHCYPL